jgi:hypothetical protein
LKLPLALDTGIDVVRRVLKLLDALDDHDDVQNVAASFNIFRTRRWPPSKAGRTDRAATTSGPHLAGEIAVLSGLAAILGHLARLWQIFRRCEAAWRLLTYFDKRLPQQDAGQTSDCSKVNHVQTTEVARLLARRRAP